MFHRMPFIGRHIELNQIDEVIQQWDTRQVICLHGPGGIGKTRLLEEICLQHKPNNSLLTASIIDFDDLALFLPENIERQIAERLSPEIFEPYLRSLLDWRKMEEAGVSTDALEQQQQRVRQIFVSSFNQVTQKQRVVLLFDTTDHIENSEAWEHLQNIISQAQNAVFVLAGRNGIALYDALKKQFNDDIHLNILEALDPDSGAAYLVKKQELLLINLDEALCQKLLLLSQGKPILIDLAVEWLSRALPQPWLKEPALAELNALSTDELYTAQALFEVQLVSHLGKIRTQMDRLTLVMSRIYPLDAAMIAVLLKLSPEAAAGLFEEAQTYVYIKSLPDGRITLHDEMRRMVNEHIWPEHDPNRERRRHDSQAAAGYLRQEVQNLTERLNQLIEQATAVSLPQSPQAELNTFIIREKLERDIWLLKSQQLYHILFTDLGAGIQTFAQMFDEATATYNLLFRETLLTQVLEYQAYFLPQQKYIINWRRIAYLFDRGDYQEAESLVIDLLAEDLEPAQRITILIQLANLEVRLGNLTGSINHFDEAARLSQQHNLPDRHMLAINGRGWAHRNQGDFTQAITDYLLAYQISLKLHDQRETARILNNMGYVNAFKGNRQAALDNCNGALRLWKQIDDKRQIAATYSTLGEIYRRYSQWTEAYDYYSKALTIFEDEDVREWISTVRASRAAIYLHQGQTDKAIADLAYAAQNGPSNLQPRVLHTQAQIYMTLGEMGKSRKFFLQCQELSYKIGAYEYALRSFADLLDLAWEFGEYPRWEAFKEQLEEMYSGRKGEEAYRLRGSSLRKIGDLALADGRYDIASEAYREGFPLIALYEVHETYSLSAQLRISNERIHQCGKPEYIQQLGYDLAQFWQQKPELIAKSPEALISFYTWQQEKSL